MFKVLIRSHIWGTPVSALLKIVLEKYLHEEKMQELIDKVLKVSLSIVYAGLLNRNKDKQANHI
jgi:hypothetical protein